MGPNQIIPCLWFDDQAETAASFYARTFTAGRVVATSRYPEAVPNPSGRPRGSVLTIELELAGQRFTLLNGGPLFTVNPSLSFFIQVETAAEADRYHAALAEGGQSLMALDAYPWSERYAWVKDRFGVSWQVVPSRIVDWMASDDTAANTRGFAAMLKMRKLDIATLERACAGPARPSGG
jgi:predicted 3-demethylubiquinone-9 3-methyltransferase (glyoxalase superfamily)